VRIVYYTTGTTGSGNLVLGISIANAVRRHGGEHDFAILSSSPGFTQLADQMGVRHQEIPFEDETQLSRKASRSSSLYKAIVSLDPDVLIVALHWFMLNGFIRELPCRKVFLCRQVDERFFRIPVAGGHLTFRPEDYDLALAIEPFPTTQPFRRIDPLILRNRDEILSRENALRELGLTEGRNHCLFAFNGKPGDFERLRKMYSYLEDEGYEMAYSTNYRGGLFPAVDYFNAFEMLICGAGYNAFWEAVFFEKEAIFVPEQRRFENQAWRVEQCQEYVFKRNGADEVAELILGPRPP
jgi:hypothetical protein